MVSPLKRNGEARPRAHKEPGAALTDSWKRKKDRYPELIGPDARCKLVFAGMKLEADGLQKPTTFCANLHQHAPETHLEHYRAARTQLG